MNRPKTLTIAFMVLALAVSIGPVVGNIKAEDTGGTPDPSEFYEQAEVFASKLKLKKTWMVTQDNYLALSTTYVDAFSPVTVKCPGKVDTTCTIGVIVSSQLFALSGTNSAQANVTIDGSGVGVEPNPFVDMATESTFTSVGSVRTMTWMKTGVSPGDHTVSVQFKTNSDTGAAGYRTLTINVFKP